MVAYATEGKLGTTPETGDCYRENSVSLAVGNRMTV